MTHEQLFLIQQALSMPKGGRMVQCDVDALRAIAAQADGFASRVARLVLAEIEAIRVLPEAA